MTSDAIKNIEAMVLKIGDEGDLYLTSKIKRVVDQIRGFPDQASLQFLFSRIELLITHAPGKSNLYAVIMASLHGSLPEQVEQSVLNLTAVLREAIATRNENAAVNIVLFYTECVRVGLINALPFISVLMDFVSLAERDRSKTKFLALLILLALPIVLPTFMEKYEMECRNLIEDLGKLIQRKGDAHAEDLAEEEAAFESLKSLSSGDLSNVSLFKHIRAAGMDENIAVRPIKKPLKILTDDNLPNLHSNQHKGSKIIISRGLVNAKLSALPGGTNGLNILSISTFVKQLITGFKINSELLLDKLSSSPWSEFSELKDWLFFSALIDLLCQDAALFETNFLFVCKTIILSLEINKNSVFYTQAFEEVSRGLVQKAESVRLAWVVRILKLIVFINFETRSSFSLSSEQLSSNDNLYYFINVFFAIQNRSLSTKGGFGEDSHEQGLA